MEVLTKQILIFSLVLLLGVGLIFSGYTVKLHNWVIDTMEPKFTRFDYNKIAEPLAYFVEIILAILLLITPLKAVGSLWFLRIAFELTFGRTSHINVFVISPFLNKVMAVLALIMFGYGLYLQHGWVVKYTTPLPEKAPDDELSRLI